MEVKLGISTLLNMAPPQKFVLAPGAIFRGNTVNISNTVVSETYVDVEFTFSGGLAGRRV